MPSRTPLTLIGLALIVSTVALNPLLAQSFRGGEDRREARAQEASLAVLESFFLAGGQNNPERGARCLMLAEAYLPKAIGITRSLYRKHKAALQGYVDTGSQIYGVEFRDNPIRQVTIIEGALYTSAQSLKEFRAKLVRKNRRWRIYSVDIDR